MSCDVDNFDNINLTQIKQKIRRILFKIKDIVNNTYSKKYRPLFYTINV